VCGQDGYDKWWYLLLLGGDDSQASDYVAATSPFYNWFMTAQNQFDAYSPAFHVGKINRGTLLNPELNSPADRAFACNSNFNVGDLNSGAFSITPQAQKFVKKIHVDAGLATKVGQITSMPVGVFVQDDGTLLVDTSRHVDNVDPCNPSPCSNTPGAPRCIVVGSSTAKCIGPEKKVIEIKWIDPADEDEAGVTVKDFTNPPNCETIITSPSCRTKTLINVPLISISQLSLARITVLQHAQYPRFFLGTKCGATISSDAATTGTDGYESAELSTTDVATTKDSFKDYTVNPQ